MLQEMLHSCQQLSKATQALWLEPDSVVLSKHDVLGSGASSTVYRGTVRGSPAAIKVYGNIHLASAAPGLDELMMTGALRRELCIMVRANQEFHHVCR